METCQPGILQLEPCVSRYLTFSREAGGDALAALAALQAVARGERVVVGIGLSLAQQLHAEIPGLRAFPVQIGAGIDIPSTPSALWCWLRADDDGQLLHLSRKVEAALQPDFVVDQVVDACQYRGNRDLTGYEDGTENPEGEEAVAAAVVSGQGEGMDGSSFVAVQQWWHDFDHFESMPRQEQDHTIGRRLSDNEELDDAPESAHVKRTAQESFDPEAFIVRRSMPWVDGMSGGLMFVAFGKRFDAFEALLTRMTGDEDGIVDALFNFTRPVTGAYFWCPPLKDGQLDLSRLGL